ncbi:MAG: 6,7-dimethyl-8-ribityllumazine synthase [Verrucomicrobiota bacterium]
MSNFAVPPRPRLVGGKRNFTIVASKFNAEFVQGLVNHTTEELRAISASAIVALHQVPGAFEIPIVVRELAIQKKTDVIIAIGVILKGRTAHAEHLARSVTEALQRIAIDHGVPVINVVLSLTNESQARERCLEDKMNRGTQAAHAAFEIANVMQEVREK